MTGYASSRMARHRAVGVFERLADDGVIDLEQTGGRFRTPGSSGG